MRKGVLNMPRQEHYDLLARSGGASRNKRRSNWSSTAFLVESLVLLFFLIACLAVFTQMFAHSWLASSNASRLSAACAVAQNAAEDFEANPQGVQNGAFDVNDADGASFHVNRTVESGATATGTMYTVHIAVSDDTGEVYSLEAQRYMEGGAR